MYFSMCNFERLLTLSPAFCSHILDFFKQILFLRSNLLIFTKEPGGDSKKKKKTQILIMKCNIIIHNIRYIIHTKYP